METTPEAEWPDEFTREEMLEQQSRLLTEECHMLQKELSRYRKNLAQLIEMYNEVTIERDTLRGELKQTKDRLSDCLLRNSSLRNRIEDLEVCRRQLEEIYEAQRAEAMKSGQAVAGPS